MRLRIISGPAFVAEGVPMGPGFPGLVMAPERGGKGVWIMSETLATLRRFLEHAPTGHTFGSPKIPTQCPEPEN